MTRHNQVYMEFAEHSLFEWMLIRSLAFGERDWMVASAIIFLIKPEYTFLSLPGIILFFLGLFFLGPIYGFFIYLSKRVYYARLKKENRIPTDIKAFKMLSWKVNVVWFPVMLFLSYFGFHLYYDCYNGIVGGLNNSIHAMESP